MPTAKAASTAPSGNSRRRSADGSNAARELANGGDAHAACPDIKSADGFAVGRVGLALAHDPAAIDHGDAVGDRDQFVELAGNQQHAGAAVGRVSGSWP